MQVPVITVTGPYSLFTITESVIANRVNEITGALSDDSSVPEIEDVRDTVWDLKRAYCLMMDGLGASAQMNAGMVTRMVEAIDYLDGLVNPQ